METLSSGGDSDVVAVESDSEEQPLARRARQGRDNKALAEKESSEDEPLARRRESKTKQKPLRLSKINSVSDDSDPMEVNGNSTIKTRNIPSSDEEPLSKRREGKGGRTKVTQGNRRQTTIEDAVEEKDEEADDEKSAVVKFTSSSEDEEEAPLSKRIKKPTKKAKQPAGPTSQVKHSADKQKNGAEELSASRNGEPPSGMIHYLQSHLLKLQPSMLI